MVLSEEANVRSKVSARGRTENSWQCDGDGTVTIPFLPPTSKQSPNQENHDFDGIEVFVNLKIDQHSVFSSD